MHWYNLDSYAIAYIYGTAVLFSFVLHPEIPTVVYKLYLCLSTIMVQILTYIIV